ncbi:cytochrome P450 [Pisolithus croceorrhizus]|nr:cytochrome P450 [Pisolithus croceorrhizus]
MDSSFLLTILCDRLLRVTRSVTLPDVVAAIVAVWALRGAFRSARRSFKTTKLRGPPRTDLVFGAAKQIFESSDAGAIYEAWAKEYGVVYEVPTTLGGKKIMLTDPKALTHYYARETRTYVQTEFARFFLQHHFGRGILWSQGEDHKRQRKSLTPAFSQAAIRNLTPIFYSSAHKTKSAWEAMIDAGDGDVTIIELTDRFRLDSVGLAGFSHDFGSLVGKPTSITEIFDTVGSSSKQSAVNVGLLLLSQVFPLLEYVPTPRTKLLCEMQRIMEDISKDLLTRTKREKEEGVLDGKEDKSIIGVLVKANDADSPNHLTHEEVLAQMKVLLVAGYETTSVTMTWALLELAWNPNIQSKLRRELLAFGEEPTYGQQQHSLPYLDAVLHETLRVHPAVTEFDRVAAEDDIIPLSEPVVTQSGEVVNSISVARGTQIGISASCINRSTETWGADAKVFRPERWLEEGGIPRKAQDIQAYRHLLTFADGPRTCLGKGFAMAEFKAVMSVLVKNFVFETRDGPNTRVELGRGMLPRPRIVGEEGTNVPLRVRRYEG